MDTDRKTAENFVTDLATLQDQIEDYYTRINNGEELELDGLDDRVDLLCAQIDVASPLIKTQIQAPMMQMIGSLERLAELLQDITAGDGDNGQDENNE